jgi:hypothetical protein
MLLREGMAVNHKHVYRLYREERLAIRIRCSRRKIENWREDYNLRRPHSSLRYTPPAEFAKMQAEVTVFNTGDAGEGDSNAIPFSRPQPAETNDGD